MAPWSRWASSVSIITLPTTKIARSRRRLRGADCRRRRGRREQQVGDSWSVRMRLISSGIVRSKERSPASTCADRHAELGRGERRRQRRVDVADDDDHVGRSLGEHRLEPHHHRGGLLGVRCRSRRRGRVRPREPELLEEDAGHRAVVVLAGVDEALRRSTGRRRSARDDRRDLHEVRPRADDVEDLGHRLEMLSQADAVAGCWRPSAKRRTRWPAETVEAADAAGEPDLDVEEPAVQACRRAADTGRPRGSPNRRRRRGCR